VTSQTTVEAHCPSVSARDDVRPSAGVSCTSQRLSLRRNFGWTLAGNLIYSGCQWVSLIVIAKVMNAVAVGQFALALAITAPIMIFANQGLTSLQATDAKGEFTFSQYFRYRFFTTTLALVVIYVTMRVLAYDMIVIVVGIAKALESFCDVRYGENQKLDRMDRTARSMAYRGVLSVGTVGCLLLLTRSIAWGAAGLALSNLIVLVVYDYRPRLFASGSLTIRLRRPRFSDLLLSHSFRRASLRSSPQVILLFQVFPLGVAAMLGSVTSNIPRYFVEHYCGSARLGIFAAIMYLLVVGRTVVAALAQSCIARLARLHAHGERSSFSSLFGKQMLFGVIMGAAGILVGEFWGAPLLRLIYRPEYGRYANVLVFVMIAAAVNYLVEFSNAGLLAVRSIRVQPFILFSCVVIATLCCVLFVPRFGISGAAWAVIAAGVFQLTANMYFIERARLMAVRNIDQDARLESN